MTADRPVAGHDCSTCPDCVHDGQECCGCYDGACCAPPGPDPARDEVEVERLCEVMHDAYEGAASRAGWETQEASQKPWRYVPEPNKVAMRAAVGAIMAALAPYVAAQVAEKDAEIERLFTNWQIARNARDAALAREVTARRDALAPVLALRDLSDAATPGPWEAMVLGSEGYAVVQTQDPSIKRRRKRPASVTYETFEECRADAALIAAAVNAVRAAVESPDQPGWPEWAMVARAELLERRERQERYSDPWDRGYVVGINDGICALANAIKRPILPAAPDQPEGEK